MTPIIKQDSFVVFDLDDTLYKEIDFLKSAYDYIAKILESEIGFNIYKEMIDLWSSGESVFDIIKAKYKFKASIKTLVDWYRFHSPKLILDKETKDLLERLKDAKIPMGLLTDGRSITQRNKIKSLKIEPYFQKIVISEEIGSEKPNQKNFEAFEEMAEKLNLQFYYIADNFMKDFVTPNSKNWITIGLIDNGLNIHSQKIKVSHEYLPNILIDSFQEIIITS